MEKNRKIMTNPEKTKRKVLKADGKPKKGRIITKKPKQTPIQFFHRLLFIIFINCKSSHLYRHGGIMSYGQNLQKRIFKIPPPQKRPFLKLFFTIFASETML